MAVAKRVAELEQLLAKTRAERDELLRDVENLCMQVLVCPQELSIHCQVPCRCWETWIAAAQNQQGVGFEPSHTCSKWLDLGELQ